MLQERHIALDTTDSTNAEARRRIQDGADEGTVLTAAHQTAGRGRLQRQWTDAPGLNLLASYVLYPVRDPEEWGGLPLLAGLALQRAVEELLPSRPLLKWPNDVLIGERKAAGILVETGLLGSRAWAVIGVGVNVNQRSFEGDYRIPPTSLLLEAGRHVDVAELRARLSRQLFHLYEEWSVRGNPAILDPWRQSSGMLGRDVVLHEEGRSRTVRAVDLDATGGLLVQEEGGEAECIVAGDISLTLNADRD